MSKAIRARFSEEEVGLIEAVMENPRDEQLRLVYADWLEEHTDQRCEYLRAECEFAALAENVGSTEDRADFDSNKRRRDQLRNQIKKLRQGLDDGWLSLMSRSGITCCPSKFQFEFECPKTWDQLTPTRQMQVRHCDACDSRVYFETSERIALQRAKKGQCVCLVSDAPPNDGYQDEFDSVRRPMLLGALLTDFPIEDPE